MVVLYLRWRVLGYVHFGISELCKLVKGSNPCCRICMFCLFYKITNFDFKANPHHENDGRLERCMMDAGNQLLKPQNLFFLCTLYISQQI